MWSIFDVVVLISLRASSIAYSSALNIEARVGNLPLSVLLLNNAAKPKFIVVIRSVRVYY